MKFVYPVLHLGPYSFYSFGLLFGCSICLGWLTFGRYFELHHIPVNLPLLGIISTGFGIVGAKLDHTRLVGMLAPHHSGFFWTEMFDWGGGYTYLGSVLAGLIYLK